jgi:hypothetical protein
VANFIWTGILYFSTSMIVYITYRTFMNDRKMENERRTSEVVSKSRTRMQENAEAGAPRQAVRRPVNPRAA